MKPFSSSLFRRVALGSTALCLMGGFAQADIIHADDVIINGGSLCVGFDCVNGESFGSDTIRMKENNTRLHFDDTSVSASFPNNDWRLIANDQSNGGANKFSIQDATANREIAIFEAGARSNALVVESDGDVGFGTLNPAVDLHYVNGNTPTLRLDQDGSSGFSPQVWDVAGNEAGFFVRDATNGSALPFRIIPGASSQALVIDDDDDIGISAGTNPTAKLHIRDTLGSGPYQMLKMENNGAVQVYMDNTSNANAQWMFSAGASMLLVPSDNAADAVFDLSNTGNLTIDGTLTELSDKNAKMAVVPVDTSEILSKVRGLQVSEWTYKDEAETGTRHIGPMAQDFYAAFGTGSTDKGIASLDSAGVALAAIQALSAESAALQSRLDTLEARLAD